MKNKHFLLLSFSLFSTIVLSQTPPIKYEVEAQAIGTTNDIVPFWMRSNQFGSIPSDGASGSFIGRAHKDYNNANASFFDWGVGLEGRVNAGNNSKLLLIEAYAKVKAGIFQLKAGRTKDVMGLNGDSSLTSGNWSTSGNTLGIPKIEISIPNFYRIPALNGLISLKGSFSHGWLGKQSLNPMVGTDLPALVPSVQTYFHQKSLYLRLGKEDWKLQLIGGLNHQAFWGNEDEYYGEAYDISAVRSFFHVVSGSTFENNKVPGSKVGNHLGSVDVGAQYDFGSFDILITRQFLYDAGALGHLANIKDGITGLTFLNRNYTNRSFGLKKVLLEFLYTKNQAGELNSKETPSGDEDYYNNFIYRKGWSYNDQNIGSPFLTTRRYARKELTNDPTDYFINNRIVGVHLGAEGNYQKWQGLTKISYTKNHGTYKTSSIGNSIGPKRTPPKYGVFKPVNQLSFYFEGGRLLANDFFVSGALSIDRGQLLYDSEGVIIKLIKRFN